MATSYSISERIFTYNGPNSLRPIAVFAVNDLTDAECEILRTSVQRHLDVIHDSLGHGPFTFDLGPNAASDLPSFVALKTELAEKMCELAAHRGQPADTWSWELGLIHDTAQDHAETIRSLRGHANTTEGVPHAVGPVQPQSPTTTTPPPKPTSAPTRFQVEDEDAGGQLVMFDTAGAREWGPRFEYGGRVYFEGSFEWTYEDYLYRIPTGRFIRIRHRSHCEAGIPGNPCLKRFSDEEAAEWLLFGEFELPEDIAPLAQKHLFTEVPPPPPPAPPSPRPSPDPGEFDLSWLENELGPPAANTRVDASEELRQTYRNPDNYWRNVWFYEQRSAGKLNQEIFNELEQIAFERGFNVIYSEGALRRALERIAQHHGWPVLEGQSGRPRAKLPPNGRGDSDSDGES